MSPLIVVGAHDEPMAASERESTSLTGGRQVVMNAKGLTLDEVRLDGRLGGAVALDDELGRATITFPSAFAAGRHTLSIAYHGPITTGTVGFFAMDYDTPSGKRRTLATNFEPADARRLLGQLIGPAAPTGDLPTRLAVGHRAKTVESHRTHALLNPGYP